MQQNHLINETSPYLLQHAHNPVEWYPWGETAIERAKQEDKVILVSIGYSACHWCHVMERESFEDNDTAALMNQYFVNIKIDREERPDLDHIYMDAVQAMTGSGGWPLNVFLTPEGKPFYGGTYFPPQRAFNRASWKEVLLGVQQAWTERRNEIEAQAFNLTSHIESSGNFGLQNLVAGNAPSIAAESCEQVYEGLMKNADTTWGGFGKAPKFPQTFSIQYLLQYYHYTKQEKALQQALLSINKMLNGGIYDQVGGGLARYSTDVEWLAPHFEKMLYDNALFVAVLCDAYQVTGAVEYKLAIEKTIAFVLDELTHPAGCFYAALDADSEGEEGKYYVWEREEVQQLLGTDAAAFCAFYDLTDQGNWEGKNILRILQPLEVFAANHQLDAKSTAAKFTAQLQLLKTARAQRVRPGLDDKIILGWNALMIKAMAKAGNVLGNRKFQEAAIAAFRFIEARFGMKADSFSLPLFHTWKQDVAKYPAFLDDYACLIEAMLELYEIEFDPTILTKVLTCAEYVIEQFSDEENLFFYFTNRQQTDVIVRKKELYDGATPSANAIMAGNLLRLSVIFDKPEWRLRAEKMLGIMAQAVVRYPGSFGRWASLMMEQAYGLKEISIVGEHYAGMASQLKQHLFMPHKVLMAAAKSDDIFPMLRDKNPHSGTAIFLCHNFACLPPFYTVEEFMKVVD